MQQRGRQFGGSCSLLMIFCGLCIKLEGFFVGLYNQYIVCYNCMKPVIQDMIERCFVFVLKGDG
jgi:hypothetical protein